jgi:PPOX class probable F420-dependent enzyme
MNGLEQFKNEKYINVETFRKSGVGVKTPVWFVEINDQLCFNTETDSGKAKRLRCNPEVQLAPCQMDGTVTGSWVSGSATFLNETDAKVVEKVYSRKYGVTKSLFDLLGLLRKKRGRVFIALSLQ